ncbi:MAG: DUF2459 domain-containing protein [Magnetospirillum sp.]|nr:DUF2459 domain-containing protein [Magnetospirillum sp.]
MTRRRFASAALLMSGSWLLRGCGSTPVPAYGGTAPRSDTLYVVAAGWHTEIGLASADVQGPLAALARDFPDARYLVFGWGERDYYMAAEPGSGDLVRAAFPGPAAMLVIPLGTSPMDAFPTSQVFALGASRPGIGFLCDYVWGYLDKGPDGAPRRLAAGPFAGSAFYASGRTYDLARTCNTFTAEALHAAGLPVDPAGVFLARQVTNQLPAAAAPAGR